MASIGHDIISQVDYFTQAFSASDRPLAILLGAGCPMAIKKEGKPLIPDIDGLTKIIGEKLKGESKSIWDTIIDQKKSNNNRANVEDVLSEVRGLRQFVSNNYGFKFKGEDLSDLEQQLCSEIYSVMEVNIPKGITPYRQLSEWVGSLTRNPQLEIFTTNYDTLLEQALEETRAPYFDGFIGSVKPYFSVIQMDSGLQPNWCRLWKIHGSINWQQFDGEVYRSSERDPKNALIYPSHLKYDQSRKMPYLALMDRLRSKLSESNTTLVTVGYSFADQHINEILLQGLEANSATHIFGFMFEDLEKYPGAQILAEKRSNLSILAPRSGIINGAKREWTVSDKHTQQALQIALEVKKNSSGDVTEKLFKLGDFNHFGSYLSYLSGARPSRGDS